MSLHWLMTASDAPPSQVVRTQRAKVGVEYVLGVGGFDLERVEGEVWFPPLFPVQTKL